VRKNIKNESIGLSHSKPLNLSAKKLVLCNNKISLSILSLSFLLSGCATTVVSPNIATQTAKVNLEDSFLKNTNKQTVNQTNTPLVQEQKNGEFVRLNNLDINKQSLKLEIDLSKQFSDKKQFQISVNELPLNDFLHYAMGELLNVSYLIAPKVKSNTTPITLELKESVSAQRLFLLVRQILNQNDIEIAFNDELFYVHPLANKANNSSVAFGFGRNESDVPNVSGEIIQLVPLRFGTNRGIKNTIMALVDARITVDSAQGLMTVVGKRDQIMRTLTLVHLLDNAGINKKAIALLSFNYIDSQTFIDKVTELLAQEDILTTRDINKSATVKFIPIEHLGKVVVFASDDEILTRIEYWNKQLDKPASGSEQSFYTYQPNFARAADLGESLAPLIGGTSRVSSKNSNQNTSSTNNQANKKGNNQSTSRNTVQSVEGDDIRLVVDERSNALIFYSTGKFYQELLPIIKKLDVMPKQVMLEVVIAEVKLTGSFAKGVEFAIKSGPSGKTTESFNFASKTGFGYSIVGVNGNVNLNLNQTDGLVNVLSRPTLLVRDGVSASISVGDDIPTVGSTTSDPINGDRETTTIQYRKTGVDLIVTPTINAQGTVIMEIEQNISNVQIDGTSISGSPSVFERKLSTEVVAGNGQTVMLGGLISENKNTNATSVPFFGALPILGHLFRNDSSSSDKTELVILVTPRIINNTNEWQQVISGFQQGLQNIKF